MYKIQNIEGLYGNGTVPVDVGVYQGKFNQDSWKKNELGLRLKDGVRGYEDTGERMYMRDFTISYPTMKGYT